MKGMQFSLRQFLCVLLSALLLLQTVNAATASQHIMDIDQSSQSMPHEEMTESHDCCDDTVYVSCNGCEQGCQCVMGSAFLSTPQPASGHIELHLAPVANNNISYLSQNKDLPERPPRA